MIKGAVIFGVGATSGLVLGGLLGLIEGFSLARSIEKETIWRMKTDTLRSDTDSAA